MAQYYTEPPQGGWTVYDEGAKSANAAASTAAATSGVGHCNFAINGGVQLTNSIRALEILVKGGTPKAADRLMFKTAGVIPDAFFEPESLKYPNRQPRG